VTSTGVLPYTPTYGRRYIFADLEQRSFEMGTRLDWTFSPTLSLQLFAQPLLSSADYVRYKQLAAAETFDFIDFGPSDPSGTQSLDFDDDGTADFTFSDRDFNFRSLVGNAVLRWEYGPAPRSSWCGSARSRTTPESATSTSVATWASCSGARGRPLHRQDQLLAGVVASPTSSP
jgi:hypothetical protein